MYSLRILGILEHNEAIKKRETDSRKNIQKLKQQET